MGLPQMQDTDDEMLEALREIRDAVQGGTLPGQTSKSSTTQREITHTELRVHDVSGKFSPPSNTFNLGNQTWVDENLTTTQIDDLEPGETQTITSLLSNESDVYMAVKGVATTEHVADVDGTGDMESAVNYIYEYQTHDGGDNWNPMIGLSGSAPMGYMGHTEEIVPGEFIGPMAGFRIRFFNRTEGATNEVTIPADEMGAQIAGIFIRADGGSN